MRLAFVLGLVVGVCVAPGGAAWAADSHFHDEGPPPLLAGPRVERTNLEFQFLAYPPDMAGIHALEEILAVTAERPDFKLLAGDVESAVSFTNLGERHIVYNRDWSAGMRFEGAERWGVYAVFAHEVAHHVLGHVLPGSGLYYDQTREKNHDEELDADYFSGITLARLGASYNEIIALPGLFGSPDETFSHPGNRKRMNAFMQGWMSVNPDDPSVLALPRKAPRIVEGHTRERLREALDLHFGLGGRVDRHRARTLFYDAMDLGDPLARFWLAIFYHRGGEAFERNTALAERLAEESIDGVQDAVYANDRLAYGAFGLAFYHGLGRPREPGPALHWLRQGAEMGDPLCMLELGRAYVEERGVVVDEAVSRDWLLRAAGLGVVPAMLKIGELHERGIGIPRNDLLALVWYERAARTGLPRAMARLGLKYLHGEGVAVDEARGVELLRKAARKGERESQRALLTLDVYW